MSKLQRGGDTAALLTGLGLGITLAIEAITLNSEQLQSVNGVVTILSRICALVGTYLVLVGLLLVARIPFVERSVGHDRMVTWHRKLGPWSLYLILGHFVLVTIGYSGNDGIPLYREFWNLITTYPWMLPAFAAFILMMMAGVTSYKRARKKMSYETWWIIHLYTYIAVALAFMHQILTGIMFIQHPLAKYYWIGLYVFVGTSMFWWRLVIPIYRSIRHQLVVERVVVEGPGIVSIHIKGRNIDKMGAQGGHFFGWRFLTRKEWWQSHPYSLSAAPHPKLLRITVKNLGDHSGSLTEMKPGTRVLAEGPYGIFTADRASGKKILLVGGGVGITPLRALMEEFPTGSDIDVIYRASSEEDLVLKEELNTLAKMRNARIHYMAGSRDRFPLTPAHIASLVPHISQCDVFVCGPDALVHRVRHSVEALGVPSSKFHDEAFAYHAS
jgi:predicted ferric reductase